MKQHFCWMKRLAFWSLRLSLVHTSYTSRKVAGLSRLLFGVLENPTPEESWQESVFCAMKTGRYLPEKDADESVKGPMSENTTDDMKVVALDSKSTHIVTLLTVYCALARL
ncbi:hypothetical protein JOM56_004575 [Amanita muscaria]